MSEDLERRVMLLEREVAGLHREIRSIHAALIKTSAEMQRTIDAALNFRDRVLATLEKAATQPKIQ